MKNMQSSYTNYHKHTHLPSIFQAFLNDITDEIPHISTKTEEILKQCPRCILQTTTESGRTLLHNLAQYPHLNRVTLHVTPAFLQQIRNDQWESHLHSLFQEAQEAKNTEYSNMLALYKLIQQTSDASDNNLPSIFYQITQSVQLPQKHQNKETMLQRAIQHLPQIKQQQQEPTYIWNAIRELYK